MIKHFAKAKKIDFHLLAFALRFLSFCKWEACVCAVDGEQRNVFWTRRTVVIPAILRIFVEE